MRADPKCYFLKNENKGKKIRMFKILAQSMENCGFQGKNRVSVITQSTLGSGVIKKPIF
jgi:hypothetical protein